MALRDTREAADRPSEAGSTMAMGVGSERGVERVEESADCCTGTRPARRESGVHFGHRCVRAWTGRAVDADFGRGRESPRDRLRLQETEGHGAELLGPG